MGAALAFFLAAGGAAGAGGRALGGWWWAGGSVGNLSIGRVGTRHRLRRRGGAALHQERGNGQRAERGAALWKGWRPTLRYSERVPYMMRKH